jgi:hypothetical protein
MSRGPTRGPNVSSKMPENRHLKPQVSSRSHEQDQVTEQSRAVPVAGSGETNEETDQNDRCSPPGAAVPVTRTSPLKCQVLQTRRPIGLDAATLTQGGRRRQATCAAGSGGQRPPSSRIRFNAARLSSTPLLTPRRASCGRKAATPGSSTSASSFTSVSPFFEENRNW